MTFFVSFSTTIFELRGGGLRRAGLRVRPRLRLRLGVLLGLRDRLRDRDREAERGVMDRRGVREGDLEAIGVFDECFANLFQGRRLFWGNWPTKVVPRLTLHKSWHESQAKSRYQ